MQIGIVGLPNVGKSTLFNALLKRQVALAANYPFATIEPNIGVVDVPDENLNKLVEIVKKDYAKTPDAAEKIPEKVIPATIKFYDIAGLVKGASEGEGLGNQFLSHIREVDAIVQVVRDFSDADVVREGSTDPETDIGTINTELILSDLSTIDSRIQKHDKLVRGDKSKDNIRKAEIHEEIRNLLNSGRLASEIILSKDDQELTKDLNLLTLKPLFYVFNTDESQLLEKGNRVGEYKGKPVIYLCAKIESELSSLDELDRVLYMQDLGIQESGLDRVIKLGYRLLGLQTFYTAGPKEVRAWIIKEGWKAPQAAGRIHTDFERGFIKAMIVSLSDLLAVGSFKLAKDKGVLRMEGKGYVMQEGDIVEFRFNV